jgi:hypothetical protein
MPMLIAESIRPSSAYADGRNINMLNAADPAALYSGAATIWFASRS